MVTKQCSLCAKELTQEQNRFCSRACYFENKKQKNKRKLQEQFIEMELELKEVLQETLKKDSIPLKIWHMVKSGIKFALGAILFTIILALALVVNHALFLILVVLFSCYIVWKLLTEF